MSGWRKPDQKQLFAAVDATWPAARIWRQDGWIFRDGQGGGKRVSAATLAAPTDCPDIEAAVRVMAGMGQPRLFMIRPQDGALDQQLAEAGYTVIDPVTVLVAPLAQMPADPPSRPAVLTRDPTSAMAAVWQAGGIGASRLDIMRRCSLPKTCVLIGAAAQPAAVAYAACDGDLVMCHAVEVLTSFRRQGLGRDTMLAVLEWSRSQRARTFSVLTVEQNAAALALYRGMGMTPACGYHYRIKPG